MPKDWDGLTVYSRLDWGVGASRASHDTKPKRVFVVHHSAFNGHAIDTLAEQTACMKSMYRFHTNPPAKGGRGWDDIGYNFVVFQPTGAGLPARVFEGRGRTRIPAAQAGHNTGTIAVCVVQLNEQIVDGTISRLRSIYRRTTCTSVKGHRDYGGTECPGDRLYKILDRVRDAKENA